MNWKMLVISSKSTETLVERPDSTGVSTAGASAKKPGSVDITDSLKRSMGMWWILG